VPSVKTQLDRICHSLTTRFGPLPSLYLRQPGHRVPWLNPPAKLDRVEEAERLLGFALPPLMRAVLLCVANGGEALLMVGVDPGLRRFTYERTQTFYELVAAHRDTARGHEEHSGEPWPAGRLPIYDRHGCGLVTCVDCTTADGAVWLLNEGRWAVIAPTLAEYVEEPMTKPSAD
jgi:hypothetical protein